MSTAYEMEMEGELEGEFENELEGELEGEFEGEEFLGTIARGIGSLCISMHAHMPEIVVEARLHKCAGGGIERLPGRA